MAGLFEAIVKGSHSAHRLLQAIMQYEPKEVLLTELLNVVSYGAHRVALMEFLL